MLDGALTKPALDTEDPYYVGVKASPPEVRILKQENTFVIQDVRGDIYHVGNDELGVFYGATRYISRLVIHFGRRNESLLLSSHIRKDNGLLRVELTNPDMDLGGGILVPKGSLHVRREKFLYSNHCYESIEIHHFGSDSFDLPLVVEYEADFKDIFEIRGMRRPKRGEGLEARFVDGGTLLRYRGLDETERCTRFSFSRKPEKLDASRASFLFRIEPGRNQRLEIVTSFSEGGGDPRPAEKFENAYQKVRRHHAEGKEKFCSVTSTNEEFNAWLSRSLDDLVMMTAMTSKGIRYPDAGIPWYCTPFGRDGIWTSILCLWANPTLAKDALLFLSATQARDWKPSADAAPGKIIHEVRTGEMAALHEIPFGAYYGSIDSTPLYLLLAGEYFQRTADEVTIEAIWPNLIAALEWIDDVGDPKNMGFLAYRRESVDGLSNQGWKDSHDAVFHDDGRDPVPPIALCEVQGYVYAAKRNLAMLARHRGKKVLAARLVRECEELQERFDRAFWIPEMSTYALAIDGEGKPCRVHSSNPGHLLYTGIVKPERARALVKTLMSETLFSGWGIRTIGKHERRYNPISYHNGSVWPHDTAIAAIGMAQYGFKDEVERLFEGLFRASAWMPMHRMPEVFCGFTRDEEDPPVLYPVACSPQAWSSATVYGLLGALLGIRFSALSRTVYFHQPRLPAAFYEVRLGNLGFSGGRGLDVSAVRYQEDVAIRILVRGEDTNLIVEK